MKFDVIQSNFTAGEVDPKLKGRVDLEKYFAGLATCENMIVQPSGGVSKRGGIHHVAAVKDSTKTTILLAFRYNNLYSYILEFGDKYIRVYFENTQIQSGGSPYEITTTYGETEVADIRITQDATNLYIVHKNHPPAILTRTDHDAWTLIAMPFAFDYNYDTEWKIAKECFVNAALSSVCWSPELMLFAAVSSLGYGAITSPDGFVWTEQEPAHPDLFNWRAICWSPKLGLFAAIASGTYGSSNRVMISYDGVIWTQPESAKLYSWRAMCWSPDIERFVAVASTGGMSCISDDGLTWVLQSIGVTIYWRSICWSPTLNLFCAVASTGTGNRVATSPDGTTGSWTSQVSAADNNWTSVCWSPELTLFVAVASSGVGNRVMTSPDGVNWTLQVSAADIDWQSVCWSPGLLLFVAVAASGAVGRAMTSPDGVTWSLQSLLADGDWNSICWSPELSKLVGVSDKSGLPNIAISYDGANWLAFIINNDWQSVCWSPELTKYVAVSSSGTGNRVATSSDGIMWIPQVSAADNDWQSVCWLPEKELFIAVASSGSGSRMMTSPNGVAWTLTVNIASVVDNDWQSVCWSPTLSIFIAVSSSGTGNRVMTSADGVTWFPQTSAADNDWTSVCWSPTVGLFVAVASSGVGNRVMTSPNGTAWTLQVSAADNDWQSVCWSYEKTLFVAVASSGTGNRVMTSPNGIAWTPQVSAADNDWQSVCWSPESILFVAVSSSAATGNVMTSPDGINWTLRSTGLIYGWQSVCWSPINLKFVAVASTGGLHRAMYSSDGTTWDLALHVGHTSWTVQRTLLGYDYYHEYYSFYSVCWCDDLGVFVAVGTKTGQTGVSGQPPQCIWVSPDGITWESYGLINNSWKAICDAPEIPLLVTVADSGANNRVAISEDSMNWVVADFDIGVNEWQSVCWSPKLQRAVAVSIVGDKRVGVSSDGKAWGFYVAATQNDWRSVCWSPNIELFVAVASSGSGNRVMTSFDGYIWSPGTSAVDNAWQSVCWSPKLTLFCAVSNTGTDNRVMTSPNGYTWTSRIPASNNDWNSVCWSEELEIFCAVATTGTGDRIMTSIDGINWESDENPVDNDWKEVCWAPELKRFVAVSDTGAEDRVMYSTAVYESWSTFDEYPSLIWFYEQRLFFAATEENQNMIWGSKSADFFNMAIGSGLDNDAIKLEVKAAHNFLWVSTGEEILIGGSNAEFSLSANSLNEALTPSNVRPALRTKFGGAFIPPIHIDDSAIFIQQGVRKLRRLAGASPSEGYFGQYKAGDLTILSSHIAQSGIVSVVSQVVSNTIIWAFRNDGVLIGLTYEPEHNIFGWHRHIIGGTDTKIRSLAIAPVIATGGNQLQDELWAVIDHTVDGGTKKYIGYMREGLHDEDTIENSFFVDAGITKTGTAFTVVDGLDHLEGEEVVVLGDGVEQTPKTVSGGEITIDSAVDKVQVGLSFTGVVETLPLEGGNQVGSSQGLIKRINAITLRLYRSLGVDVGDVSGNVDSYDFGSTDLFTGDTEPIPFAGGHDRQSCVRIASSHPLPLNLLSIMSQARTK